MATLQYIGARYVPTFYLNSLGTPEWEAGVAYEPLTIVTYNNNSYTSRKPVPADVGNPSANSEYWAQTGVYNAQIGQLQSDVAELQESVDDLEKMAFYYTPEMFGAKGDGVTDDTQAFKDMFDAVSDNDTIVCSGKYVITDQIEITQSFLKISGGFTRSEYNPVWHFVRTNPQTPDIYLTGAGVGFSNIIFQGGGVSNSETLFECNAAGNNGNMDTIFDSCGFFQATTGAVIKGRNVLFNDCIISTVTYGVQLEEITGLSTDLRGYIIQGCRVHGCGELLHSVLELAPSARKGIAIFNNYIDYTPIIINAVSGGIEVVGNIYKRYQGGGPTIILNKNTLDTDYTYVNVISDNVFEGAGSGTRGLQLTEVSACVCNNTFSNFQGWGIGVTNAGRLIAKNNNFYNVGAGARIIECSNPVTGVVKYNTGVSSGAILAAGATVADNDSLT